MSVCSGFYIQMESGRDKKPSLGYVGYDELATEARTDPREAVV